MIAASVPLQPEPLKKRRLLSRVGVRKFTARIDLRAYSYLTKLCEENQLSMSKALTMVLHEHEKEMQERKG